jgi:multidrug efflux system membrane fusion protein
MRAIPILMALAVIAGLYVWIVPDSGAPVETAPPAPAATREAQAAPVRVVAFRSEARPVESAILLRGRTEAHRMVDLKAETEGLVISEPLRAGAEVEAGDVICRLDTGSRESLLREAEAKLAQAQADAEAAETLAERGLTAENTAKARRAALQAAQAALRQVRLDIERLEIHAPFDGVLESDAAELGSLMRKGDVCARVISLDPIEIVGYVPEAEVDALSPGMTARARLVSGQEVEGRIAFVSRSADPTTRTFRVEIEAPNPDRAIRDGMTAEITVPLEPGRAHLVPQAALTLNDAGELGVRVVEDGRARFIAAGVLREERQGLWLSGLPEEAAIIYTGQEFVSDGRRVEAVYKDWRPQG